MPEVDSGPTAAANSHAAHTAGTGEGSRFRRFFKRFGRRPSDDEQEWAQSVEAGAASDTAGSSPAAFNAQLHGGGGGGIASRTRRGTATGTSGAGTTGTGGSKNKWFGVGGQGSSTRGGSNSGGGSGRAPAGPRPGSSPAGGASSSNVNGSGGQGGFGSSTAAEHGTNSLGGGMSSTADTAAPAERSPPPQLMQLPSHEPMLASEMHPGPPSSIGDGGSSFNHARSHPRSTSSDLESLDRRTVDTGKSRASTKPTTLMSIEMRDQPPMAHIATHRHGEASSSAVPRASGAGPAASTASGGTTAVQFVNPDLGRSASGTIVNLPGHEEPAEDAPFVNVPALSRPHPANNPSPHALPPDNASVLTLASSTAAQSIGGGAPSSRGHQAYSIGTRSIRRNSSDTYASLMALPPLSRRGSNESGHSGWTGGHPANLAGPGAPSDRVSVQRTPSQRTVATQLSIPFSASASNAALAAAKTGSLAGGGGGGGGDGAEGRTSLGENNAAQGPQTQGRTAASRIMEEAKLKGESVDED